MSLLNPALRKPNPAFDWMPLPTGGVFIGNNISGDLSRYILFLSKTLANMSVKQAFILLNRQNKDQYLNSFPNVRFGRNEDAIWFAPCDIEGHLIGITPFAAIFFKNDSIEH